jgi:hypothetical protein
MIGPDLEAPRSPSGPGFAEAVTFAFGDPGAGLHGSARLGVAAADPPAATVLALMFADGQPVAAAARGGLPVPAGWSWEGFEAGGVRTSTLRPLTSWRIAFAGQDGGAFDLAFDAVGPPFGDAEGRGAPASAGGLAGYTQLCRVTGTVEAGGRRHDVACLGQRAHEWGVAGWDRIESARSVSAWLGDRHAAVFSSVRPAGAAGHDAEAAAAWLVDDPGTGESEARPVEGPRLSTAVDAEGRPRRAAFELWESEDAEVPRRASGQAVAVATLHLGELRLDAAVFAWRMEGREGAGRYDLLRRA